MCSVIKFVYLGTVHLSFIVFILHSFFGSATGLLQLSSLVACPGSHVAIFIVDVALMINQRHPSVSAISLHHSLMTSIEAGQATSSDFIIFGITQAISYHDKPPCNVGTLHLR